MQQLTFWEKYKVFIFGLLGSIALALNELLNETGGEGQATRVYLYAALMAALSFISTEWRGQGVSLTGIIGTLAGVFVALETTGSFSWFQFIISGIMAVLAAVASPAKPLTYEKNRAIVQAKKDTDLVEDTSKLPLGVTKRN